MIKNILVCLLSFILLYSCLQSEWIEQPNVQNSLKVLHKTDYEIIEFNANGAALPFQKKVITHSKGLQDAWQQAFSKQKPLPLVPNINFDKKSIIYLGFGERNQGGEKFDIDSIYLKHKELNIVMKAYNKNSDRKYTTAYTNPFMFIKIDKLDIENIIVK